jgi:phosphoserine aminotransferase
MTLEGSMKERLHNFYAGPAVLPKVVISELQKQLVSFEGTGVGLMEISHRSAVFDRVVRSAQDRLRRLLSVSDDYEVLFLQGGASLQFLQVPLNLAAPRAAVDYIDTGAWSVKAVKEAQAIADARVIWSGKDQGYNTVPADDDYAVRSGATYLHYTTNNTIAGTQFRSAPRADVPLVADASSDICSRPMDVSRHGLIYAGAQKNLGPSGVTVVIVRRDLLGRSGRILPTMLDYQNHIDKATLLNTPNTLGIFVVERVLAWIEGLGTLEDMAARNQAKAGALYAALDASEFWQPHAEASARSLMNVTWRIADHSLEGAFVQQAERAGFIGLKGHRSVGGIRASTYNACPHSAVEALVAFMHEFERTHG